MILESPLLGIHETAGAAIGEYFGTRLPAHYGDFAAEYAAIEGAVALVDSNYRAFFSFTGPDRQRYLNAILTSNVRDLKPGQGAAGLLLTPQGHILAEVETFARTESILASSHAMVKERTFATLDKFIIMDDVTLTDVTDSMGTLDLAGPKAADLLADLGATGFAELTWLAHERLTVAGISCGAVRREFGGFPAATIVCGREHLPELWRELSEGVRRLGGRPAGMNAVNSVRLEFGVPWFGADYGDQQIPHEVRLEHSHISYDKGCYTGQEIVERVRSRGQVNRRLTPLRFSSAEPPSPGTKLLCDGTEAGIVTSAAYSPRAKKAIGLAYVRREKSATGCVLDASSIAQAEVLSFPASDSAATASKNPI